MDHEKPRLSQAAPTVFQANPINGPEGMISRMRYKHLIWLINCNKFADSTTKQQVKLPKF